MLEGVVQALCGSMKIWVPYDPLPGIPDIGDWRGTRVRYKQDHDQH